MIYLKKTTSKPPDVFGNETLIRTFGSCILLVSHALSICIIPAMHFKIGVQSWEVVMTADKLRRDKPTVSTYKECWSNGSSSSSNNGSTSISRRSSGSSR